MAMLCLPGLLVMAYSIGAMAGMFLATVVFVAGVGLALRGLRTYPHAGIGLCNLVTLFRFMLVTVVIAALMAPDAADWPVFIIAATALVLDGVDGWLARLSGHSSAFGASFDMEVDGVLAMTLALLAYTSGQAGVIVVLLGLPMYAFRAAQIAWPWLRGDLPPRFSRKLVCVIQIAVLIVIALPVTAQPLTDMLALPTILALVWSFTLDIRALWIARSCAS
ncbi:CDP-alcohol phosphatidyltransferase family protein [Sulfitobacter guttiformis]|uniref:Phosphatidylglycerophosphate synthase n=1 Tax=Sulfitobacter guttiformis TaxID=74349 RepID=A0A420DTS5_9RHOB|nr:CDP-alcohol phosphatidyltransferase family protein [Sulfitobacter guttiformis]KIN71091.1 CDP-alcohol phosphatidyltransferase [Sulfitobacter guttiformis KCTC 32187]RKE97573.1 phosphatidylglycerophosphate synthase [Sulfitobacter guttiformis]